MRTLHVAAMPFPSHQGTQALIHQMLSALSAAGHDTHLLCYAHGAFPLQPEYTLHRAPGLSGARSLRSGPAPGKLAHDALLLPSLARLVRTLRPDALVAHHVEAALLAHAARVGPFLFVAHTSLRAELPSYFAPAARPAFAALGARVDRYLCRRAARVLAVSPLLARLLQAESARPVFPLALPWPCAAPASAPERAQARRRFAVADDHELVLYAGNLDAYQGLAPLLAGLERLACERAALRLLIATESDARALLATLRGTALLSRLRIAPLAGEAARRAAHAAADVALVPRASSGGVPIKLLDALARGVAVIAARRAAAGLALQSACTLVEGDDPGAWRDALAAHFREPSRALSARVAGPAQLALAHAPGRFVADVLGHVTALQAARESSLRSAIRR